MTQNAAAIALAALVFLHAPACNAQAQETFDVASAKLDATGGGGYPGLAPGGQRFTATNLPLTALIMLAYDVTPRQISGVPNSFATERYDIDAKCDHPMTKQQACFTGAARAKTGITKRPVQFIVVDHAEKPTAN